MIGFLFIQCPAQGSGGSGSGSSGGSSDTSSNNVSDLYDSTFNNGGSGADNWIFDSAIRSDGKIFIVGDFAFYNGIDISDRILRLNADGTIDSTFNNKGTGANQNIVSIVLKSSGSIFIGGNFTTYNNVDVPDSIIQLDENGEINATFNKGGSGANNGVRSIIIQPDGMILIGGSFTTYNSVDVPDSIIRLNENGSVDSNFNNGGIGADSDVYCMALQTDGKILIGGTFIKYNGVNVPYSIARLNTDGSIDTSFNNAGWGANQAVHKIAVQSDGKILIVGDFTTFNNVNVPDRIIRLNSDGSLDPTFNNGGSGTDNSIRSVAVQSDGKILIGGDFTTYNGNNIPDGIIRLNTDGTIDTTFNNSGSGCGGFDFVYNINIFQNGKVLIGGGFTHYNGDDVPDFIIRLK